MSAGLKVMLRLHWAQFSFWGSFASRWGSTGVMAWIWVDPMGNLVKTLACFWDFLNFSYGTKRNNARHLSENHCNKCTINVTALVTSVEKIWSHFVNWVTSLFFFFSCVIVHRATQEQQQSCLKNNQMETGWLVSVGCSHALCSGANCQWSWLNYFWTRHSNDQRLRSVDVEGLTVSTLHLTPRLDRSHHVSVTLAGWSGCLNRFHRCPWI